MTLEDRLRAGLHRRAHAIPLDLDADREASLAVGRRRRRTGRVAAGAGAIVAAVVLGVGSMAIRDEPEDALFVTEPGPVTTSATTPTTPDYETAATWELDPSAPPPEMAQSQVRVLVHGIACSGSRKRTLRPPRVQVEDERVVVTFSAEPLPRGTYSCPGIPGQPYTVDVGQPIGNRRLVDGICLHSGPLVETSYCETDRGVRWTP